MNGSVVITGIGSVLPTGTDIENLWDAILTNKSPIAELESSYIHNVDSLLFGNITEEMTQNLKQNIPRELRRFCSNEMAWSFNASDIAIKDAKIDLDTIPADRRGMFTYQGGHSYPYYPSLSSAINKSIKNNEIDFNTLSFEVNENKMGDPFVCIKCLSNSSPGINSIYHQFKGDCGSFSSQNENGAINALQSAVLSIKHGYSDLAVVNFCGTEKSLFLLEEKYDQGRSNFKHNTSDSYCPYDEREDGYILGEGAVAFVLESYESAVKRNAHIYFKIDGVETHTQKHPNLEKDNPYEICFRKISNRYPIELKNIDFVFGQGIGTNAEDIYELNMLKGLFKQTKSIPILNTTPTTGYITGVSSMVNILVCALIKKHKTLPKISNLKKAMNSELSLVNKTRELDGFQNVGIFSYNVHGFHSMVLLSDASIISQGNI